MITLYNPDMAVQAQQVTVGTSPQRLDAVETVTRYSVMVTNRGGASVFLGGSGVTTAGYELPTMETRTFLLRPSDNGIFAIAASGTVRVDRIQVGWSG